MQNLREIHSYNFEQSAVEFLATDDFRFGGLPPNRKQKTGSLGGISSPCRGLLGDIKMSGIFSKIREILRVKEKPLSPPSGETGNLRMETGPKYSSGSRVLQVVKVW